RPPARPLQPPGPSAIVPAMTATTRLAEFVVKTSLRDCPDAVLAQTRRAALDSIGVMVAGATEPVARSVRAVARAEGGVALCTVLGTSLRAAPGWAALANGAAGPARGRVQAPRTRRQPDAPRPRHRRLDGVGAQGELRLDDEAVPRGPRRAERHPGRAARA